MKSRSISHWHLFLPTGGVVLITALLFAWSDYNNHQERSIIEAQAEVNRFELALSRRLEYVIQDALFLANSNTLIDAIDRSREAQSLRVTADNWVRFSEAKRYYDQIRWIDETGMERVRVNRRDSGAYIVPQQELQSKKGRYYFDDAIILEKGQFNISPLDLNLENGQIEHPIKPMIRIGTPVYDSRGGKRGILIINYLANDLLDLLKHENQRIWLVNQDGFWLKGDTPQDEWGFMYDKPELSVVTRYTQAWERIRGERSGTFVNAQGGWAFTTIIPVEHTVLAGATNSKSGGLPPHYAWKLIRYEERSNFWKPIKELLPRYLGVTLTLLTLTFFASLRVAKAQSLERLAYEQLSKTQFAMDQAGIGIHWVERDTGRFRYVNEHGATMLGYRVNELLTLRLSDLDPNLSVDNFSSVTAQRFGSGKAHFESVLTAKDGSKVPVEVVGFMMPDSDGESASFITFLIEISERKAVEEKLRISRASLAEAQRIAGLGSWRIDLDTNEMVWSEALYQMFGLNAEQPPPNYSRLASFFTSESWNTLATMLSNAVETGCTYELELETQRNDGTGGWILTRWEVVRSESGKPISLQGIAMDIKLRKEAEQLLEQAKKSAVAATVAKSTFLANMSHEIRTPLNAIIGMSHLMRRAGVTAEQEGRLNKIEVAGNHLLEIINAILDLSKIDAGRLTLEETDLHLGAQVANIVSMFHERAQVKGIRLVTELSLPTVPLLGDTTRLQQILLNFVGNAIKFTDSGHVIIRAAVLEEEVSRVKIYFGVEDTGVGLESEAISRLFGAFEQADNSTTRKYGGTGLGLAISKKLVELMGGEVGVASAPRQGSTFWFTAWLKKGSTSVLQKEGSADLSAEALLLDRHAGKRILLAEDEIINREVTLELLEDTGLVVDTVEDGVQAIELANRRHYDLILMDMQMPNMDGLMATQRIRNLPQYRDTPIVAMTANAFSEDKARCFEAGMNDFISKPAVPEKLFATILKWMETQ